ncbi:MAG: hypothetical protein H6R00_4794 [Proteobacteria bacterium]|nr:hypothetical protein [Pseudomonadota bacterium]
MAKRTTQFVCQSCGAVSPRWVGKCEACGAWNSFVEEVGSGATIGSAVFGQKGRPMRKGRVVPLVELSGEITQMPRLESGIAELDRAPQGRAAGAFRCSGGPCRRNLGRGHPDDAR